MAGFLLWSFSVLVFCTLLLSSYTLDSNEAVFSVFFSFLLFATIMDVVS